MNGVGVVHLSKPNLLGWLGTECHFNTALVEKVRNCLSLNDRNTSEKGIVRQSHCSANTEEYTDRNHSAYDTSGQCNVMEPFQCAQATY
ncbi:hypothetical protein ACRRTK_022727 [Alexandromys fortis]